MIIDGKLFAEGLRKKIAEQITMLRKEQNITPGLTVILVGNDPASRVYVSNKQKFAKECGINSVTIEKTEDTAENELLSLIDGLNKDASVNSILIQLPLPKHISVQRVLQAISPEKDVDGFHPINVGRLSIGENALTPCTSLGAMLLLKDKIGDLTGKKALVVGRSNIVGKSLVQLLLKENCTVTVAHSKTVDLPSVCREADIVIAAVGKAHLVKGDWIKEGATVIDVGINRVEENGQIKLVGDVDFESASLRAKFITPVPGGVGPMTIACLLRNTLTATCVQYGLQDPNG